MRESQLARLASIRAGRDEAAVEAHRNSDHFKTLGRAMGPFMDGRPELLRLQEV